MVCPGSAVSPMLAMHIRWQRPQGDAPPVRSAALAGSTSLGDVKRAISDSYHAIRQGKYARRYLAEVAYCFNRRFRLREMLPRLVRATMLCKPHPELTLRLASNFHG